MSEWRGVLSFDPNGPIKSWSRLGAINSHNLRLEPQPHCDPDGPAPVRLHGSLDLVADVKRILVDHGIDPASLRKNACIAFELILSVTRDFFTAGSAREASERLTHWMWAAHEFVCAHWGRARVASMVLHREEHTPHYHIVLVPLREREFRRPENKGRAWTLNGRVISGPGEYQRAHDAYSVAMAPLGIVRGRAGFGAKHRPYGEELIDLEAAKLTAVTAADHAAEAEAMALRKAAEREVEQEEQDRRRALLDQREAAVKAAERRVLLREEVLRRAWADASVARAVADAAAEGAETERRNAALDRIAAAAERTAAEGAIDALQETIEHAIEFRASLLTVPLDDLPLEAIRVLRAIHGFERAAELVRFPVDDTDTLPMRLRDHLDLKRGRGTRR